MMAFLGILVLTSCGNDAPDERGEGPADQAEIMLGERVYQANCATCHGSSEPLYSGYANVLPSLA